MNQRKCVIFMLVALTIAGTALAKGGRRVLVEESASVGGHSLASGTYEVTWQSHNPGATVSFLHQGKIVATAEGKIVERPKKPSSNEVVYSLAADGSRQIQEIRFRGSTEVVVFAE